jgi:hypothetical protein
VDYEQSLCISIIWLGRADKSFVSLDFKPNINLKPQKLKEVYTIEFANGQEVRARDIIMDCTLSLAKKDFSIESRSN